jgi:hypothetical protein
MYIKKEEMQNVTTSFPKMPCAHAGGKSFYCSGFQATAILISRGIKR